MLAAVLALAGIGAPTSALADEPAGARDTPGYPEPVIQWGAQKGETCDDVAAAVYGSTKYAALVTRYNRVRCAPGVSLPPGTTLVLPAKPTTLPTARLASVNPDVRERPPGGGWSIAASGAPLFTNTVVNTLDKGRADIRFVDRTRVYMAANTLVIVYGTAAQTSVSKAPPPVVQVDAGEVKLGLAALRGDDAVEVAVDGGGRVSAHTREVVVEKKGARTTVAVYDGKARVTSGNKAVDVPERFASRFVGAAPPSPPRPLPPAPSWEPGAVEGARLGPRNEGVVAAAWSSVPDARAYRFEIARDAEFHDLVAREEVGADVHDFRAERLPEGTYFYAVRAIDKEDYLGLASPRRVRIVAGRVDGAAGSIGGAIEVSPYGVLVIDPAPSVEVALDGGPFGPVPPAIDLARRRPAKLTLRDGGVATDVAITYRPARALARVEPSAKGRARVTVRFEGLDGVDVFARVRPALRVAEVGAPPREVALARAGDAFTADVALRGEGGRVEVIDGRGVVLGHADVAPDARAATSKERRPPIAGPSTWVAPALPPLADVAPFAPTPFDAAGLGASITGRHDATGAQGAAFVSGAVGPVAIDAVARTEGPDATASGEAGAWLGARVRVLRVGDAAFELAPSFRVGLPFEGTDAPARVEPALALGGVVGRLSYVFDAGLRARVQSADSLRAPVPSYEPFFVADVSYDLTTWMRASGVVDDELLIGRRSDPTGTPDLAGVARGGLTLGAEVGGVIYGAAFVRATPFTTDAAPVAAELALGVRAR